MCPDQRRQCFHSIRITTVSRPYSSSGWARARQLSARGEAAQLGSQRARCAEASACPGTAATGRVCFFRPGGDKGTRMANKGTRMTRGAGRVECAGTAGNAGREGGNAGRDLLCRAILFCFFARASPDAALQRGLGATFDSLSAHEMAWCRLIVELPQTLPPERPRRRAGPSPSRVGVLGHGLGLCCRPLSLSALRTAALIPLETAL